MLSYLIGRRKKRPSAESAISELPGFDREFYLARNPDVAASGTDPLGHYLKYGWREGREPSAGFTGQRYLTLNPDVQAAGINPLVHYVNYGLAEGRAGANSMPGPSLPEQRTEMTPPPPESQSTSWPLSSTVHHKETRLL